MLIHAICVHSDVTSGHDPDCYYCMFSYIAIFMPGYTKAFANVNKLSSRYTIENLCASDVTSGDVTSGDVTSGHDPDCYYCMFSYIFSCQDIPKHSQM